MIAARISDDTFAVPAVTTCGIFGNPAINLIAKLPSASGSNSAVMDTVIRIRNYQLGNITQQAARQAKVRVR